LILARELRESCLARFGLTGTVLATCKGAALERIAFHHPFYERLSPVFLGEYVTLEHLLLAFLSDEWTRKALRACGADIKRLERGLREALEQTQEQQDEKRKNKKKEKKNK